MTRQAQVASSDSLFDATQEGLLAELSNAVPTAAGLFVDAQGALTVLVTDIAQGPKAANEALRLVRPAFNARASVLNQPVRSRLAQFTLRELATWRRIIAKEQAAGTTPPGIRSLDLNEGEGLLVIGVSDMFGPLERSSMATWLRQRSIPESAVRLSSVGTAVPAAAPASILHRADSLFGGLIISFSTGGACTIGFTGRNNGVDGFITASHCTTLGSVDGSTAVYQETNGAQGSASVGYETIDNATFYCGIFVCKAVDASFFAATGARELVRGVVGHPASWTVGARGSGNLDSQAPYFAVRGTSAAIQGEAAYKLGKTSGATAGHFVGTCINFYQIDDISYTCVDRTDVWTERGDSGGPLFGRIDTIDGTVVAFGIVGFINGAGGVDNNLDMFAHPIGRIVNDFGGTLDVTRPPTLPSVQLTGYNVTYGVPEFSWSAVFGAISYRVYKTQYDAFCYPSFSSSVAFGTVYSDGSFAAAAGAYTPFVDCPAATYEVVASDGKGNVSAKSAGVYFRGTGAPGNN